MLTIKNFNPTPKPTRTFTVSWTETSTPGSFNPVWSDDAAWLTAWSTAFDDFFWYSAVKLSSNWTESAIVNSSSWILDISQLGTLTSWDNVMIKFPVRWIKMSKSWSTITLSITDELGKSGYQYYAFQKTWNIADNTETTATTPLYLGTYLSYKSSNVLKSWSWQTPQGNNTMANELNYASANGTWWTIMGWYQRCLINAYYMMKYGNPDCQTVIGRWFVDWNSAAHATWWTNSQTNATYWSTSWTTQCKLFGLEDWWGNQYQWIGWMFTDSSKNMYVALHDFTANMSTSESQYKNAGAISHSWSYYCLSSILGTNKWMFWPNGTVNNTNYNTYYCDYAYVYASRFALAGGDWSNASSAGAFRLHVTYDASSANAYLGSRLMFL